MGFGTGDFNHPQTYQIKVKGLLKKNWALWLDGMLISLENKAQHTTITVTVSDQAALRGILNKLWDLNLTIILVAQKKGKNNE